MRRDRRLRRTAQGPGRTTILRDQAHSHMVWSLAGCKGELLTHLSGHPEKLGYNGPHLKCHEEGLERWFIG